MRIGIGFNTSAAGRDPGREPEQEQVLRYFEGFQRTLFQRFKRGPPNADDVANQFRERNRVGDTEPGHKIRIGPRSGKCVFGGNGELVAGVPDCPSHTFIQEPVWIGNAIHRVARPCLEHPPALSELIGQFVLIAGGEVRMADGM